MSPDQLRPGDLPPDWQQQDASRQLPRRNPGHRRTREGRGIAAGVPPLDAGGRRAMTPGAAIAVVADVDATIRLWKIYGITPAKLAHDLGCPPDFGSIRSDMIARTILGHYGRIVALAPLKIGPLPAVPMRRVA